MTTTEGTEDTEEGLEYKTLDSILEDSGVEIGEKTIRDP